MGKKIIYALGVGHNTPVCIDLAISCGYSIGGLYHYNSERTGEFDHGYEIIGSFDDLLNKEDLYGMNFLLTMGNNDIRKEIFNKVLSKGGNIPTLIHPASVISVFSEISPLGVQISPFVYIQADSKIGCNTVILSHVNISHTTSIGRNCFIAGGAIVGAYTTVEDNVFIGQKALSISGKVNKIGNGAYIGAASVLTSDIPDNAVCKGVPAKIIRYVSK